MPDAREIGDSLAARSTRLQLGTMVYDPTDPMSKMFFNILATFAEFEIDLLRMRTAKAWRPLCQGCLRQDLILKP
ncbi:recombinase family protein [Kribbella sp. NPDC050820]|uniref:recombinase family protein n=1 Tax=Kribbella sp. NPDC050820 TaxID=3155408 RepID=UPI0033D2A1EF